MMGHNNAARLWFGFLISIYIKFLPCCFFQASVASGGRLKDAYKVKNVDNSLLLHMALKKFHNPNNGRGKAG